jgi:lysophospholipase L1-like esterase
MRGDEPPKDWANTYSIVCIGGSTTQCFFLDDHKAWPYLLQQDLKARFPNAWVGNGGLDGHSSRAHITFMNRVIPAIRPKVALVLVGANDVAFSISKERRAHGTPFEKVRLVDRIRLLQLAMLWKRILIDKATVVEKTGQGSLDFPPMTDKENVPSDIREMLPGLAEYRDNIRKILAKGRETNTRVVFMTQPMLFDDTPHWRGLRATMYWLGDLKISAATFWRCLDAYNQELMRVCREEKAECIDLASAVPHSEDYFYDPAHFNDRGSALVAEKVAAYFKGHPGQ